MSLSGQLETLNPPENINTILNSPQGFLNVQGSGSPSHRIAYQTVKDRSLK